MFLICIFRPLSCVHSLATPQPRAHGERDSLMPQDLKSAPARARSSEHAEAEAGHRRKKSPVASRVRTARPRVSQQLALSVSHCKVIGAVLPRWPARPPRGPRAGGRGGHRRHRVTVCHAKRATLCTHIYKKSLNPRRSGRAGPAVPSSSTYSTMRPTLFHPSSFSAFRSSLMRFRCRLSSAPRRGAER